MKNKLTSLLIALCILLAPGFPVMASGKPPEKGGVLPTIILPISKSPPEKAYLGLSGDGLFKIPQIKSKVVLIFWNSYSRLPD